MIRPRNLAISPLVTIVVVAAVLVGASLLHRASTTPDVVVPPPEPLEEPTPVRFDAADVPRYLGGTFAWSDSASSPQKLGLDVHSVEEDDGRIVATGRGTYTTARSVDFDFRIEVDRRTGAFSMTESNPNVTTGFVTDGRHVGTVASFDDIEARWVGQGGTGTLTLRAAETTQRTRTSSEHPSIECGIFRTEELAGDVKVEFRREGGSHTCVESDDDQVTVHYEGWTSDGELFDSSIRREKPATFRPNQLIDGWKTALAQLCVGDDVRVHIPADQAYGNGPRTGIPTGDLVFDIELLDVEHAP